VETHYATKLDLETNYLTKPELGWIYAQKSELETNYAMKSDWKSDYLTKADANSLELTFLKSIARSFPLSPGSPLNGIIHHLTHESGGNVHDRGVGPVTANRPYNDSPDDTAKNIADLETNSWLYCADADAMSVYYDLKNMKVTRNDYAIRSRWNAASPNPKSCVIGVSNDG
jgi:hypothetical protein